MGMNTMTKLALAGVSLAAACSGSQEPEGERRTQTVEPVIADVETAPLEEADAPAYVGVWAADASWCAIQPGSADPSPIAVTEAEFIGYENLCRIGYAEEGADGAWRMELICDGEGVEYTELAELDLDGDTMQLRRGDGPETAFVRCEDA